jgi:hypothetical protein
MPDEIGTATVDAPTPQKSPAAIEAHPTSPKVISMSPSPRGKLVAKAPFTFSEAMAQLVRGKRVRRAAWPNVTDHVYLKDGIVWIHRDDKEYWLLLGDGDILNNDWVVV